MAKTGKVVWKGDMTFEGSSGAYPGGVIRFDADEASGGHDQGFRPMELLLTALAGCTAMDVISILKKKKQDVTGLEVETEGVVVDEYPRVYSHITILYRVTGHAVDPVAVARAIELSETRYCSVSGMLKAKAEITTRYEIHEA